MPNVRDSADGDREETMAWATRAHFEARRDHGEKAVGR